MVPHPPLANCHPHTNRPVVGDGSMWSLGFRGLLEFSGASWNFLQNSKKILNLFEEATSCRARLGPELAGRMGTLGIFWSPGENSKSPLIQETTYSRR